MKTIELVLNESLAERIEQGARLTGQSVSEFVQQLIRRSLHEWTMAELERQEIEAYKRLPVQQGEFDVWETEQAWGEP